MNDNVAVTVLAAQECLGTAEWCMRRSLLTDTHAQATKELDSALEQLNAGRAKLLKARRMLKRATPQ